MLSVPQSKRSSAESLSFAPSIVEEQKGLLDALIWRIQETHLAPFQHTLIEAKHQQNDRQNGA